ncbi:multiple inositol polyphosphate phosphatase 1-like [Rhagoletis pomonella]|uniref:multiple inositol polyphosphate phosphatase 1-like n=1 Tax=Rhagoletis pomonella TaxID=28610 RepID=UPI00177A80CF|nr:multiple inositol polyphosphate phosphatase 1-like [Rhagoletis pomonella]
MKYYHKLGYGYEENSHLNCRAVQDMLIHLDSPSAPNVVAYFGHTSGVQTFLTALGIAKDVIPLTAANYNSSDYRWKTSNLDPFASNFVAVKYACETGIADKVIFFLNQNAVDLDWCDVGLCNWSEVLKRYNTLYTAECSTYYCADSGADSLVKPLGELLLFISSIVYLLF